MTGAELYALAARLFPIPRSITGDGVRQSLAILAEQIALDIHEIPTGTPVFDWTVPRDLPAPLYELMSAMQGENAGVPPDEAYYAPYPEDAP